MVLILCQLLGACRSETHLSFQISPWTPYFQPAEEVALAGQFLLMFQIALTLASPCCRHPAPEILQALGFLIIPPVLL